MENEVMPQVIKLTIELPPDGVLRVSGPLADKILCYGMLEHAKEVVRSYNADNQSKIKPVGIMPTFVKKKH